MEVCVQRHDEAALGLHPGKEPQVSIPYGLGVPQSLSGRFGEKKSFFFSFFLFVSINTLTIKPPTS